MEWIRPVGIALTIFFAYLLGDDDVSRFHILGPWTVSVMSGSVAFEGLFLGSVASDNVGYAPNRAYQVQSALNNAAAAVTALLVIVLDWDRYADATIVIAMLLFFAFSASNHVATALTQGNMKRVNLLRPVMTLALIAILVPHLVMALTQ